MPKCLRTSGSIYIPHLPHLYIHQVAHLLFSCNIHLTQYTQLRLAQYRHRSRRRLRRNNNVFNRCDMTASDNPKTATVFDCSNCPTCTRDDDDESIDDCTPPETIDLLFSFEYYMLPYM